MPPTTEEMAAMVDEYERLLANKMSRAEATRLAGLTAKRLEIYRKKLGRATRISGMEDRYKRICDHVKKRVEESPTTTLDAILKEIGSNRQTYSDACKKLGVPRVKRPQWALSKMLSDAGKKSAPPAEHYQDIVDSVDSVVDGDEVTTKDACKIVGVSEDAYYHARRKLGLGRTFRRNKNQREVLTYGPGNQMVPGIHGMIRMETVIGLETLNISREFKGRASESEMQEILRQRIHRMTGGKVQVKF